MDKLQENPFSLPKTSNQHPNLLGVQRIFMESVGVVITKSLLNFKKLKNLEATETDFAKKYEKCKIMSEFSGTKTINLDDYACSKVQFLLFKDEEYDWRRSNYPFNHAKTLHRAERKAFLDRSMTRFFYRM